ncbi:hypothetical protein ATCC90586_000544 [Pythium insidiosum]|nr:hypothetical protein ATCC90586_000544 [Pythium insidiosum]
MPTRKAAPKKVSAKAAAANKKKAAVAKPPKFRGRVLEYAKAYSARSLVELWLRAGVGGILSKRHWWRKWCRKLPAKRGADGEGETIREKWLREFEDSVTSGLVHWTTTSWVPNHNTVGVKLQGFPADGSLASKRAFLTAKCQQQLDLELLWGYPIDSESTKRLESFSMIVWFCSHVLLNRSLLALAADDDKLAALTVHAVPFSVGTPESCAIARDLIMKVRRSQSKKAALEECLPDAKFTSEAAKAFWFHLWMVGKKLDELRACVTQTVDNVIEEYDLSHRKDDGGVVSPGPVDETCVANDLIPAELEAKFSAELAALENVPSDLKDWHPGSNNQVLDLVHPSLYCCVFGQTRRAAKPNATAAPVTASESMNQIMFAGQDLVENASRGQVQHQWIPSEFQISRDGSVQVLSYINNLHPVDHVDMYDSIAEIFAAFVPMFDQVLTCLTTTRSPKAQLDARGLSRYDTAHVPWTPMIPKSIMVQPETKKTYTLKGTTAQVIVKIAEIHLTPENPRYPGGAWHVEGTDAEQIVATGIYYFGCDNITESKLSFRVSVKEPRTQEFDNLGVAALYGLEEGEELVQYLGAATAVNGRCIVFPNTLQHKVEPFELADPTRPGVRKILAFFLVDPSRPIPSTAVIPPQQEDWRRRAQETLLPSIPNAVMNDSLASFLGGSMSLHEAKRHREELMEARRSTTHRQYDSGVFSFSSTFSYCEH